MIGCVDFAITIHGSRCIRKLQIVVIQLYLRSRTNDRVYVNFNHIYLTLNVMHINAEIRSDRRIKIIKRIEKYRNNEIIIFIFIFHLLRSFFFIFIYKLYILWFADKDRNLSHFSPLSILHSLFFFLLYLNNYNYFNH